MTHDSDNDELDELREKRKQELVAKATDDYVEGHGNEMQLEEDLEGALTADAGGSTTMGRNDGLRYSIAQALGENIGGNRDYYDVFNWDKDPDVDAYYSMALRNPFGYAVTFLPSMTSWRDPPKIVDQADTDNETDFEDELSTLEDDLGLWNGAKRADKLCGIGKYGALILQYDDIDDVDSWSQEVSNPDNLIGLRPVSRRSITQITLGGASSERWGKPVEYTIDLSDENDSVEVKGPDEIEIHHSRVIHIPSDQLLDDEVRGVERQAPVYNNLVDIEKAMGSAGELAYRASAWGININIDPDFKLDDPNELRNHARRWYYGLEPILQTEGAADVENLGGENIDPNPIIQANVKGISAAKGMPQSVLVGNETGERATTEDLKEWYGKIQERREEFVEPRIVRALIDRLQEHDILPEPQGDGYDVEWKPLAEMDEKERSEIQNNRAQMLKTWGEAVTPLSREQEADYLDSGDVPSDVPEVADEVAEMQGQEEIAAGARDVEEMAAEYGAGTVAATDGGEEVDDE